jgi:hypothetical protein
MSISGIAEEREVQLEAKPKFNSTNQQRVLSRAPRYLLSVLMDDRPHKAHRPAQSGVKADKKKGKGKQQGFNEKVFFFFSHLK